MILLVERRYKRDKNGGRLYSVDEAVRKVEMKMHISEAQDCLWTLHTDSLLALESEGYEEIPHKTAYCNQSYYLKIEAPLFKATDEKYHTFAKIENFEKNDFDGLLREAVKHTDQLQGEKVPIGSVSDHMFLDDGENVRQTSISRVRAIWTLHTETGPRKSPFKHKASPWARTTLTGNKRGCKAD